MCVFSPVIIGYIYILHTPTIYIHIYVYIVYIYSYILIIKQLGVNKAVNGICKRNFTVYKFPPRRRFFVFRVSVVFRLHYPYLFTGLLPRSRLSV